MFTALDVLAALVVVVVVVLTEQFVCQHVELLLVQASLGDGGKLPAENLRKLTPLRLRRRKEELQVLWRREERKLH